MEIKMENSKYIAKLVGPTLMALTISEALNLHIWENVIAPITYLSGILLFIGGLSIVRVHNYWERDWTVIITLLGWIAILFGLFRIFAPEAKQAGQNIATFAFLMMGAAVGIFLNFKAYRRDNKTEAR